MTAAEFLHSLRKSSRPAQVQAAIYYLKHQEGSEEARPSEVREVLVRGRVPGAKNINVSRELARSVPYVHQPNGAGWWAITERGGERVRELLALDGEVKEPEADVRTLERLVRTVRDDATRDYIDEAIRCLSVGARRAAVVFLWSGAVSSIRDDVWKYGAKQIEGALQRHNPRARFRKREDFEAVKDSELLQVAQDLTV